jgi:hypothetical protein
MTETDLTLAEPGSGHVLRDGEQVFYEQGSANYTNCVWTSGCPSGKGIFKFTSFLSEMGWDYLNVFSDVGLITNAISNANNNGGIDNSGDLGRFTGTETPNTILNAAAVQYLSDQSFTQPGANVAFTHTCGGLEQQCGLCPAGFQYNSISDTYQDFDECSYLDGGCDQLMGFVNKADESWIIKPCTNTHGSYTCNACPDGFETIGSSCRLPEIQGNQSDVASVQPKSSLVMNGPAAALVPGSDAQVTFLSAVQADIAASLEVNDPTEIVLDNVGRARSLRRALRRSMQEDGTVHVELQLDILFDSGASGPDLVVAMMNQLRDPNSKLMTSSTTSQLRADQVPSIVFVCPLGMVRENGASCTKCHGEAMYYEADVDECLPCDSPLIPNQDRTGCVCPPGTVINTKYLDESSTPHRRCEACVTALGEQPNDKGTACICKRALLHSENRVLNLVLKPVVVSAGSDGFYNTRDDVSSELNPVMCYDKNDIFTADSSSDISGTGLACQPCPYKVKEGDCVQCRNGHISEVMPGWGSIAPGRGVGGLNVLKVSVFQCAGGLEQCEGETWSAESTGLLVLNGSRPCAVGYVGGMCIACDESYARNGDQCVYCGDVTILQVLARLIFILILVAMFGLLWKYSQDFRVKVTYEFDIIKVAWPRIKQSASLLATNVRSQRGHYLCSDLVCCKNPVPLCFCLSAPVLKYPLS